MKLKEAIHLSEIEDRRSYPERRLEAHIALKLLIEAGKLVEHLQSYPGLLKIFKLPGETPEVNHDT